MSKFKRMIFATALCCVVLCFPGAVLSEFYKYLDTNGNIHFVGELDRIPEAYRDQINVYEEDKDHLSEEEKQEALKETDETMETDVIIRGNNVLVPVVLGYEEKEVEVVLILDTGASVVTIHREIAEQLGIQNTQKGTARVAGGEEISFNLAKLSYVRVGSFQQNEVTTGIIDQQGRKTPYNGLLGMNFLQHFEYAIDFDKQVVRWKTKNTLD